MPIICYDRRSPIFHLAVSSAFCLRPLRVRFQQKRFLAEMVHSGPRGIFPSMNGGLLGGENRDRLLRSTAGVAAARASRSKLSASSKTAFLAPGSVNCPATSRASSARLSHSRASFNIDSIWSSLSSFVSCPFRSRNYVCVTKATSRPKLKPRAKPCPKARATAPATR